MDVVLCCVVAARVSIRGFTRASFAGKMRMGEIGIVKSGIMTRSTREITLKFMLLTVEVLNLWLFNTERHSVGYVLDRLDYFIRYIVSSI